MLRSVFRHYDIFFMVYKFFKAIIAYLIYNYMNNKVNCIFTLRGIISGEMLKL